MNLKQQKILNLRLCKTNSVPLCTCVCAHIPLHTCLFIQANINSYQFLRTIREQWLYVINLFWITFSTHAIYPMWSLHKYWALIHTTIACKVYFCQRRSKAKFTAEARHTLPAARLNKEKLTFAIKGDPSMNCCFIEILPSRCSLRKKRMSGAVYWTVGSDVYQGLLTTDHRRLSLLCRLWQIFRN